MGLSVITEPCRSGVNIMQIQFEGNMGHFVKWINEDQGVY